MRLAKLVGDVLAARPSLLTSSLKNVLRTALFRSARYREDHDELELIFQALSDPWNFETSAYEQARLAWLLREVERHPHESVLEVGCAEGLFTRMLTTISPRVVGIDVSPTAVARARARCPEAICLTIGLDAFETWEPFDVVVCAETLYYVRDVGRALVKLSSLGRCCVVSYIRRESRRLDRYFERMPGVRFGRLDIGERLLLRGVNVATWSNDFGGAARPAALRAATSPLQASV